jgi:hypothetical protein
LVELDDVGVGVAELVTRTVETDDDVPRHGSFLPSGCADRRLFLHRSVRQPVRL